MNIELTDVLVFLPNGKRLFAVNRWQVKSGQHVLIQGESGSGKTTFLHLLAGLFTPQKGQVRLGATVLNDLDDKDRCAFRLRHVGVIFQRLNLLDHLTVAENIRLAQPQTGHFEDRLRQALHKVNMNAREQERVAHLSLGEQQRVAVARVLAQAPDILLADEPTSSLDETNARFVMQSLKQASRGKTLVVVSHDHRITGEFDAVLPFSEYTR